MARRGLWEHKEKTERAPEGVMAAMGVTPDAASAYSSTASPAAVVAAVGAAEEPAAETAATAATDARRGQLVSAGPGAGGRKATATRAGTAGLAAIFAF